MQATSWFGHFQPFHAGEFPSKSIDLTYYTLENNFGFRPEFTNYLKDNFVLIHKISKIRDDIVDILLYRENFKGANPNPGL